MLKAKENKYVFRRDLKTGSEEACLIFKGNLFQSFGAAAANDLSALFPSSNVCQKTAVPQQGHRGALYLDVVHVGGLQLLPEVRVFLQILDDLPEVAVVVQPRLLETQAHVSFVKLT